MRILIGTVGRASDKFFLENPLSSQSHDHPRQHGHNPLTPAAPPSCQKRNVCNGSSAAGFLRPISVIPIHRAVCASLPEARAGCGKSARPDPCRGYGEIRIPNAPLSSRCKAPRTARCWAGLDCAAATDARGRCRTYHRCSKAAPEETPLVLNRWSNVEPAAYKSTEWFNVSNSHFASEMRLPRMSAKPAWINKDAYHRTLKRCRCASGGFHTATANANSAAVWRASIALHIDLALRMRTP